MSQVHPDLTFIGHGDIKVDGADQHSAAAAHVMDLAGLDDYPDFKLTLAFYLLYTGSVKNGK